MRLWLKLTKAKYLFYNIIKYCSSLLFLKQIALKNSYFLLSLLTGHPHRQIITCNIGPRPRGTRLFLLWTVHGRSPLVSPGVQEVVFRTQLIGLCWPAGPVLVLKQKKFKIQNCKIMDFCPITHLDWDGFFPLYLMQDGCKNSPGLGELIAADEVHLGANKRVQDEAFIRFR